MALPQTPTIIMLRPGDKVLVALVENPDPGTAEEYVKALYQSFPGVEFVFMGGVAGIVAQPDKPLPQKRNRRPRR